MKNKVANKFLILLTAAILISVSIFTLGCQSQTQDNQQPKEPLNLTGTWRSVNSNSEDSWQEAEITDSAITIYWVSNKGDTKSLYWAGSYVPPTEATETYSWDSVNDKTKTKNSLLAAQGDTKTITYENNQLLYEASAMGTTKTVRLERI